MDEEQLTRQNSYIIFGLFGSVLGAVVVNVVIPFIEIQTSLLSVFIGGLAGWFVGQVILKNKWGALVGGLIIPHILGILFYLYCFGTWGWCW